MRLNAWTDIFENRAVLTLLKIVGLTYVGFMFVAPVIQGRGDWDYIQAVWDRWQSLNVGILAFAASIIALSISRISQRHQLQREFISARALLPHALSELAGFCDECAAYFIEVHDAFTGWDSWLDLKTPLKQPPEIPTDIFPIFTQCIRTGETHVAETLAQLLSSLQVHRSRMHDLHLMPTRSSLRTANAAGLALDYLVALALIRANIDKAFDFARGEGSLDSTKPNQKEIRTAYAMMKVNPLIIDQVWERTQRFAKE
ncbi:MAG: hypothetical protein MUF44_03625 [Hydrogenophaga sp.]|jgi:hypothetical protein|nr:hypothetical protein [Hydrogenophaga sp.]